MCILWGGTRTLPQGGTIVSCLLPPCLCIPSLPCLAAVWTCPLELREGHGGRKERLLYPGDPQGPARLISGIFIRICLGTGRSTSLISSIWCALSIGRFKFLKIISYSIVEINWEHPNNNKPRLFIQSLLYKEVSKYQLCVTETQSRQRSGKALWWPKGRLQMCPDWRKVWARGNFT